MNRTKVTTIENESTYSFDLLVNKEIERIEDNGGEIIDIKFSAYSTGIDYLLAMIIYKE